MLGPSFGPGALELLPELLLLPELSVSPVLPPKPRASPIADIASVTESPKDFPLDPEDEDGEEDREPGREGGACVALEPGWNPV